MVRLFQLLLLKDLEGFEDRLSDEEFAEFTDGILDDTSFSDENKKAPFGMERLKQLQKAEADMQTQPLGK